MATLIQCRKVAELHQEGYKGIDPYSGVDIMDRPIGGPAFMQSPEGKIVKVMPNGSIIDVNVSEFGI